METTAYALLAQMAVGRLKLAGPIVTWLTNQKDPLGGFVSTQVSVEVELFSYLVTEITRCINRLERSPGAYMY